MRGPQSLRARLVVANLIVVGVALGTVLVAVSLVGPGYFAEAMGHPPDDPAGQEMDAATLAAFGEAVRTALIAALVVAIAVAIAVALAVSTRIAGPITRLAAGARRIAGGHYAERVPTAGEGEVADLAASFNAMTSSLEATEQRRLRLVGDVAHELRTPLATLDGYLEGLEDGVVEPEAGTWRLLRRETARLNRMVGDLQDLWRAEAGDLPLRLEPVDVSAVARDAVDRAKAAPGSHEPDVRLDAPDGLLAVVDRDRLAQILDNYLSNALRYAPEGSPVVVRVADRPGEIVVAVSDRGPGLTAEQRASVFERFYRIDPSRSRALGGAGIGLAIARALAEAMRGRVWAESDGPGRGSTFFVAVPRA
ncbi:MAG TPA: ATP-binding protein [Candidatus Limnocylindrales bacterium]|nr:ATP-binding protein [Candidatus Limnocylindrales bacterium]